MNSDEAQRIINQTGILKNPKLKQVPEPFLDPVSETLVLSIPLTVLHFGLEFLVHSQFSALKDFTVSHVLYRHTALFAGLCFIVYLTIKIKSSHWGQLLFMIGGIASGCHLIYITTENEVFGAMLQTPGLCVLWVLCIIQLDLIYAVSSLVVTFAYYHRDKLSKPNMMLI